MEREGGGGGQRAETAEKALVSIICEIVRIKQNAEKGSRFVKLEVWFDKKNNSQGDLLQDACVPSVRFRHGLYLYLKGLNYMAQNSMIYTAMILGKHSLASLNARSFSDVTGEQNFLVKILGFSIMGPIDAPALLQ